MVENALVVHICAALEVILCSRRLLQIFVQPTIWAHHGLFCQGYGILYARLHSELCSSANIHTKPKPAYHSNYQLLYTTLADAIMWANVMHIQRLLDYCTTISMQKKQTRLVHRNGFAGFWFELEQIST